MEIINQGRYLKIRPQSDDNFEPSLLLGYRQKKNDPWYIVENNIVNRVVLGLQPLVPVIKYDSFDFTNSGLQPYQVRDVEKMLSHQHILNANPMGLGKTVEAIKYVQCLKAKSILVVTPKIIRWQWVDQFAKWANIEARVYDSGGTITAGSCWIINYDKLRNESVLTKFRSFQWDVLIIDEAHKIKNRKSKQTLAVKSIPALHRIALTGTPILRYVDDLWSILHFLDLSYSGISYWTFIRYFCHIQETPWGNKIVGLVEDPSKIAILNKLISETCIRNESIEVAHGKYISVIKLPMNKEQRNLYKNEKNLLLDNLPENCTISNGAVLTTRLRQTTSWPGLFLPNVDGPKFEWILEMCQNNPEEKILVFSTFAKTVEGLSVYLKNNKIGSVTITGQHSAKENDNNKQLFLKTGVQVLIGTIGAMGQGFDGLQYVCRTIVFIDREWSPEIMVQAEDRLHRMGQDKIVNIYYLECQGSFDQHVGRINQTKSEDIRRALQNDN